MFRMFCSFSEHSEKAYRMDRRRGKLVLICNTRFDPRLKLNDRKGTERDIDAIWHVFRDILHFEVQEVPQLKAHEMQREIANGQYQIQLNREAALYMKAARLCV